MVGVDIMLEKLSTLLKQKHLHELEGPDGGEEVLLRLVARHVLLQSFRALCELQIVFQYRENYV